MRIKVCMLPALPVLIFMMLCLRSGKLVGKWLLKAISPEHAQLQQAIVICCTHVADNGIRLV